MKQKNYLRFLTVSCLIFLLVGFLSACDSATDTEAPGGSENTIQDGAEKLGAGFSKSNSTDNIPWFEGSIEEAFAYAKHVRKPLFLYWGAVWCPPCEQIKQTVFKHPTFLAQTQLFVPVYLDGDTERAQYWGEYFSVAGYPTMVLFAPNGEELTRIPGGIETQRYIDVFQLALNGLNNIAELLKSALQTPEQVNPQGYTQLAFYSWGQANLPQDIEIGADTFRQLANNAQAANNLIASSRLYFHYLNQVVMERDESAVEFGAAEKTQARQTLLNMFEKEDQVLANIDYMVFDAQDLVPMIADPGEHRQQLTQAWISAMDAVRFSRTLSSAEQLATWYPQLLLYWINNPDAQKLPEALTQKVLAHIHEMNKSTQGKARQTVVNKIYQVLEAAHLYDESRQILLDEIKTSHAPYYFMSGLAGLEEELGNKQQAVLWLQRAYEAAEGAATRFQWGVEYVTGMIRMAPDQQERIVSVTQNLIRELDTPSDVFSGRNFGRLNTLLVSLNDWQSEVGQQASLDEFFNGLLALCASVELGTTAGNNCSTLKM